MPADRRASPPASLAARAIAVALAVTLAVVGAACGASGGQGEVPSPVGDDLPRPKGTAAIRNLIDRAIEDTIDQRSAGFVVSATVEAPDGGQATRYRGAVDRVRRHGNVRVTYRGRGWLSVRALRERAYVATIGPAWKEALNGNTWLRVSSDDLVGIGTFDDLDLAATILWRVVDRGDVEAAGTETVAGVRLANFRFTLPDVPERVPGAVDRRVRRLTSVSSDGERTVTGIVGIGSDGLVHRVRLDTEIGPPSDGADRSGAETAVRYDALLFGFGRPVEVEVPPRSDTVAFDDAPEAWQVVSWLQGRRLPG